MTAATSAAHLYFVLPDLAASDTSRNTIIRLTNPPQQIQLVGIPFKRICTATIEDKGKLMQSLALIRRRGYAFTREELYRGTWGLAAPLLRRNGVAIASLAITGGRFSSPQKRLLYFPSLTRQAAREISEKLSLADAFERLKPQPTGS